MSRIRVVGDVVYIDGIKVAKLIEGVGINSLATFLDDIEVLWGEGSGSLRKVTGFLDDAVTVLHENKDEGTNVPENTLKAITAIENAVATIEEIPDDIIIT